MGMWQGRGRSCEVKQCWGRSVCKSWAGVIIAKLVGGAQLLGTRGKRSRPRESGKLPGMDMPVARYGEGLAYRLKGYAERVGVKAAATDDLGRQ